MPRRGPHFPTKKILAALTGIQPSAPVEERGTVLQRHLSSPPTYMIDLLLISMLKCVPSPSTDRRLRLFYATFRGVQYCIVNAVDSNWSIESSKQTPEIHRYAKELVRKLQAAGKMLSEPLAVYLDHQVAKGNFSLQNSFSKVHGLYEFFRDRTMDMIKNESEAGTNSLARERMNVGIKIPQALRSVLTLDVTIDFYVSATIAFFFSYTEEMFDILLALDPNRTLTYREFRDLSWQERFKATLPVASNKSLADIYEQILIVKQEIREVILQGFGASNALYVPVTGYGSIPVSYEAHTKTILSPNAFVLPRVDAERALSAFAMFDAWMEANTEARYAVLYAESGLPIPFHHDTVEEVQTWMTSSEEFIDALFNRGGYGAELARSFAPANDPQAQPAGPESGST